MGAVESSIESTIARWCEINPPNDPAKRMAAVSPRPPIAWRPWSKPGVSPLGHGIWVADGGALPESLRSGTARMAALIGARAKAAIPAIVAGIDREAARYRHADGLAIPLAAIVAYGRKASE